MNTTTEYGCHVEQTIRGPLWVTPVKDIVGATNKDVYKVMLAFAKANGVTCPRKYDPGELARRLDAKHLIRLGLVERKNEPEGAASAPTPVPTTAEKPPRPKPMTEWDRRKDALRRAQADKSPGQEAVEPAIEAETTAAEPVIVPEPVRETEADVLPSSSADEKRELILKIEEILDFKKTRWPWMPKWRWTSLWRAKTRVFLEIKREDVEVEYLKRVLHNLEVQMERGHSAKEKRPKKSRPRVEESSGNAQPDDNGYEAMLRAANMI